MRAVTAASGLSTLPADQNFDAEPLLL